MSEQYEYVPHRLLRRRVRDIASGVEGVLMAVVNENVSDTGAEYWMELAYIRAASGREFTTAVANVQPAYDQPKTAVGRRHPGSA
ncbi:hypothetical protein BX286_4072 [Streptomyces sp. 3211.6]|uniref:hypothetical protein n=1 Tax=unclassified Streptomyces TaxID=2593676 RepID=UPI000EB39668|nr:MULTISPECIES: hypothetical protein [unclassified Streptomyces]RKT06036.1 hypothetical protein BX286_4072 [Streptomyces sp. 3211.6]RPF46423.1 hypothetical protein EDD96_2995 [Streptomyces sp. Ag109_G2-6]